MSIEEVINRAVQLGQTIEIEYCTRAGKVFTCKISDIRYSQYYGGEYIEAYRLDIQENRTFKISRIMKVNGQYSGARLAIILIGYRYEYKYNCCNGSVELLSLSVYI